MPNKVRQGQERRAVAKDTVVKTTKGYDIRVKTGSPYAEQAKKMGAVVSERRAIDVNKNTDPLAAGISPEEKKARMKAITSKKK